MSELVISNKQARHLVLHLQGLARPPHLALSDGELYGLICRLGFVQVDSIKWVERAQHMTLFARNQTYRPIMLKKLIEREQKLFEGWTHDASIVPSEYYCIWRHRFERQTLKLRERFIRWQGEGFIGKCDEILALIAKDGPLRSRDMERPKSRGPQVMWQWHDGKAALEYLWRTGQLAISGRDGFQKIYDLSNNAIPAHDLAARCDRIEFIDWTCRSALERLGFGTPADIARYFDHISIAEVKTWLEQQPPGEIINVHVETANGSPPRELLAFANIKTQIGNGVNLPERLRVLSPFDPVIRDRNRLSWLFNFDYRIEIYVPEEKRKYGYYVFPLLERDRLVGRIDMRAHRGDNALQVKKLWLEKGCRFSKARESRLSSELVRQARLSGVANIEWLDGARP